MAHEILIDPIQRETFDKIYRARKARAERFKSLDSKRKNLAEDLVAREEAYKKAKLEERTNERNEHLELEKLKREGERLRKMKEQKYGKEAEEAENERRQQIAAQQKDRDEVGPLDTTLRLKWLRKQLPFLELGNDSIYSKLPVPTSSIDSIVVSAKLAGNPKTKYGTALVSFRTLSAAVKVVEAATSKQMEGIEATWASGQEPEIVRSRRERGPADGQTSPVQAEKPATNGRAATIQPPRLDETNVLDKMRAREQERARMEEEIRNQDAHDEGLA